MKIISFIKIYIFVDEDMFVKNRRINLFFFGV